MTKGETTSFCLIGLTIVGLIAVTLITNLSNNYTERFNECLRVIADEDEARCKELAK